MKIKFTKCIADKFRVVQIDDRNCFTHISRNSVDVPTPSEKFLRTIEALCMINNNLTLKQSPLHIDKVTFRFKLSKSLEITSTQ